MKKTTDVFIGWEIEFFHPRIRFEDGSLTSRNDTYGKVRSELRSMGHSVSRVQEAPTYERIQVRDDCSMDLNRNWIPVEIVTPPLPYREALCLLKELFSYIDEIGGKTDDDCSLHVNLSYKTPIKQEHIENACFLVPMFLNDNLILRDYGRTRNEFCISVSRYYLKHARRISKKKTFLSQLREAQAIYDELSDEFGKCVSINLCHIKDKHDGLDDNAYIEFRCIGNKNYHKRYKDIVSTTDKYIRSMEKSIEAVKKSAILSKDIRRLGNEQKRQRQRC